MTADKTATVKVQVQNNGGSQGVYTAILTVDGAKVEEKNVTVAAGATEAVTFSLTKDTPGSYQVVIGGLSSTLVVERIAKIEISFNPNPVPCKYGHWHWRVILTEVNGIGVKLNNLTMYGAPAKTLFTQALLQLTFGPGTIPAHPSTQACDQDRQ